MFTFTLNDVEQKNAEREALKHRSECPFCRFTYTFNANGPIGISVTMTCLYCKKEFDITDLDSW